MPTINAIKGGNMSDFYKQQADWLKTWQESQEAWLKQYAGWGDGWMANMLGGDNKESDFIKGWFKSQEDWEHQFREFGRRTYEMINNAWSDKVPAEILKVMNVSS